MEQPMLDFSTVLQSFLVLTHVTCSLTSAYVRGRVRLQGTQTQSTNQNEMWHWDSVCLREAQLRTVSAGLCALNSAQGLSCAHEHWVSLQMKGRDRLGPQEADILPAQVDVRLSVRVQVPAFFPYAIYSYNFGVMLRMLSRSPIITHIT